MNKINSYYLDMIAFGVMLFLTVIRDVTATLAISPLVKGLGIFLAIMYLFTYRWINKPAMPSGRNNSFTVLYGIVLAILAVALTQELTYVPGGATLSFWGLLFSLILVAIDVIIYTITKTITINRATIVRLVALICITTLIWKIPIEKRFLYTHRNNAEFIEFYETRKDDQTFWQIHFQYEQQHGPF